VIRNPYPIYAIARGAKPGGNPRVNWNAGSTLEANLQALVNYGAPPVADDWPLGTGVAWPSDWQTRMSTGKVLEWIDCGESSEAIFDTAASLICDPTHNWPVVIGTAAFGGPHCVVATSLRHSGSTWYLGGLNSWGPTDTSGSATIPGRWEYSERQLRDMGTYGSWCPVSTVFTELDE
jgi:hypothetical protein